MKNENYTLLDKTKNLYKKYLTKGLALASAAIMLGSATGCGNNKDDKGKAEPKDEPRIESVNPIIEENDTKTPSTKKDEVKNPSTDVTIEKDTTKDITKDNTKKETTPSSIDEAKTDTVIKETPAKKDETKKPVNIETSQKEEEHKHKFSCWYAIDDELEERACDYEDGIERRAHSYETVTKYVYAKNGSHYEITEKKCTTCGHIVKSSVKKDCDYEVTKHTSKKEYVKCTLCNHEATRKHNLGVKTTNRDGSVTQKCMNPGCEYVYTLKPSHNTGSISNGGGSNGGSGSTRPSKPSEHIHVYGEWTSLDDTYEQTTCRECGEKITREHKYTETTNYKDFSDSMHEVITSKICINCNHKVIIAKSYQTHNFDEGVKSEDGKTITYTCKDCGHTYTKSLEKPPVGHIHDYKSKQVVRSNNDGKTHTVYTVYTCTNKDGQCNKPSYEEKGETINCTITNETGRTTGHDDREHYTEISGTCSCGQTITETINREAHNMSTNDNRVYTHDKDSYCYSVTEKCSGCDYTETKTYQHNFKSSSYQNPETGDITITHRCSCGVSYTEFIPFVPGQHTHKYTSTEELRPDGNGKHTVYTIYTCIGTEGTCDKPTYEEKGATSNCTISNETGRTTEYNDREHYTEISGKCSCGHTLTERTNTEGHNMSINDNRVYTHDKDSYCYSVTENCSGCGYTETRTESHNFKSSSYQNPETGDITITHRCSCGVSYTEFIPYVPAAADVVPEIDALPVNEGGIKSEENQAQEGIAGDQGGEQKEENGTSINPSTPIITEGEGEVEPPIEEDTAIESGGAEPPVEEDTTIEIEVGEEVEPPIEEDTTIESGGAEPPVEEDAGFEDEFEETATQDEFTSDEEQTPEPVLVESQVEYKGKRLSFTYNSYKR